MFRRLAFIGALIAVVSLTGCSLAPTTVSQEAGGARPASPSASADVTARTAARPGNQLASSAATAGMPVDYFGRPCRYENFHIKPQVCLFPRR